MTHFVLHDHGGFNGHSDHIPRLFFIGRSKYTYRLSAGEYHLRDYHDAVVIDFWRFCWPISYIAAVLPSSTSHNHPSAIQFASHMKHYIQTELSFNAIGGPFQRNSLHQTLICLPLQTVPKWGSTRRHIVMDLSFHQDYQLAAVLKLLAI